MSHLLSGHHLPKICCYSLSQDVNDLSLAPSLTILDHAQILKEIMTVYQSSLGDEDEDEQIAGFEKILDIMVDPAIDMCTRENEEKKRLRPRWDEPVFVINCLSYLEVCNPTYLYFVD